MKTIGSALVLLLTILSAGVLSATPSFRELCREMVAQNGDSSVVRGVDGWLFLKEELSHLAAGRFWGENAATATRAKNKVEADPLPAIVEYNTLLAKRGITLYLMIVPPKALVYADKLAAGVSEKTVAEDLTLYEEFFGLLEKNGVHTIDLLPVLLENRNKENLYCKTDTHFSGDGVALFADAAAAVIQKADWYAGMAKQRYEMTRRKVTINGDLALMAGSAGMPEELEVTVVSTEDGRTLESDASSPVILLGDSHTLVFSAGGDLHAKGAGLFDNLSARLGFAVDLIGVRGSGVTPARIQMYQRSKKDASYLDGKKAVIWCFAARDLTGPGGWRNIPVAP